MPISLSQNVDLECTECQLPFQAEVWFLVDARERPDVWEICRRGSIRTFTCPRGHVRDVDAPLMLHSGPGAPVIFCPAKSMGEDEAQQAAGEMLAFLMSRLPPNSPTDYLENVAFGTIDGLPEALAWRAPISQVQAVELECPECRLPIAAEIWTAIDSRERPDLWARVLGGDIHAVTCLAGHRSTMDFPMLLHDGPHERVLYCISTTASTEENENTARTLLRQLYASLTARVEGPPLPASHWEYLQKIMAAPYPTIMALLRSEADVPMPPAGMDVPPAETEIPPADTDMGGSGI